ncbi:carbohydrate ABC transporter permease [Clostridium sp. SYSU_GA19001]|uniref:carbohydrate ABC transporter permease n=1 Tax=Clostridium caldaquaticum TaxID=2940653 RepID=UPI0020778596|nr:carbohydrate ABC transporter permease [Clostridium caldaquaticum]MCM8711846.1 carbohydrate ABC transporter permease [Clostridium caldaquaticum]
MLKKESKIDKIVLLINITLLTLIVLSVLLPLIYVVIGSFMKPTTLLNKGLSFNPKDWSLTGYERVFKDGTIWRGFANSFYYSTLSTVISLAICLFAAYPLTKKDLVGKKIIMIYFVITMFFNGGLIPTYMTIKNLKMLNTVWAIVIPGAVNVWNIILIRTYYQGIPQELREAAIVDGASDMHYFFKILLPLCKPIIAVLMLWGFVGQWNSWFSAMIYLDNPDMAPLQLVLRKILVKNQPSPGMIADIQALAYQQEIAELLKYSTIVISSLPLILMYPFFQKYFEKGVLVGSIKG